jgi:hypothetical protein
MAPRFELEMAAHQRKAISLTRTGEAIYAGRRQPCEMAFSILQGET